MLEGLCHESSRWDTAGDHRSRRIRRL